MHNSTITKLSAIKLHIQTKNSWHNRYTFVYETHIPFSYNFLNEKKISAIFVEEKRKH